MTVHPPSSSARFAAITACERAVGPLQHLLEHGPQLTPQDAIQVQRTLNELLKTASLLHAVD